MPSLSSSHYGGNPSDYTQLLADDPEGTSTLKTLKSAPFTEYTISHAPHSLLTDYLIDSSALPPYEPLYHLESSAWKNEPDLVMRERSKDGPIAGLISFRWSKGGYWLHVGRDKAGGNKIWKEMEGARKLTRTSEKWWKMDKYEIEVPCEVEGVVDAGEIPSVKTLLFEYSRQSPDSPSKQSKLAPGNWKILDGDTGRVIGFLYDRKAVGSFKGRLVLAEDGFRNVKREWVLLAVMGLIERRRRQ